MLVLTLSPEREWLQPGLPRPPALIAVFTLSPEFEFVFIVISPWLCGIRRLVPDLCGNVSTGERRVQ